MKKKKPRYMMTYLCASCNMDTAVTENDKPFCRYCDKKTVMTLISKKEITPEVVAERLKTVSDRMFSNLRSAYDSMTDEEKAPLPGDIDPEKMMLNLLAKAKKFKEDIQKIKLRQPEKKVKKRGKKS
jgi:hypothetical protein